MTKEELLKEKGKLQSYQIGLGVLGTVLGWYYANKTGGRFFRYVGFGFMGGVALGSVGYFMISPKLVNIQVELNKIENGSN